MPTDPTDPQGGSEHDWWECPARFTGGCVRCSKETWYMADRPGSEPIEEAARHPQERFVQAARVWLSEQGIPTSGKALSLAKTFQRLYDAGKKARMEDRTQRFPFYLERRANVWVLQWKDDMGCRPATEPEIVMWRSAPVADREAGSEERRKKALDDIRYPGLEWHEGRGYMVPESAKAALKLYVQQETAPPLARIAELEAGLAHKELTISTQAETIARQFKEYAEQSNVSAIEALQRVAKAACTNCRHEAEAKGGFWHPKDARNCCAAEVHSEIARLQAQERSATAPVPHDAE